MNHRDTVRLSQKRAEIIRLICECGLTNGEISKHMGTTEQVVKNELRRILMKLNVRDRLNLCIWYHTGSRPQAHPFPIEETRRVPSQVVVQEEPARPFVSAEEIRRRQERAGIRN